MTLCAILNIRNASLVPKRKIAAKSDDCRHSRFVKKPRASELAQAARRYGALLQVHRFPDSRRAALSAFASAFWMVDVRRAVWRQGALSTSAHSARLEVCGRSTQGCEGWIKPPRRTNRTHRRKQQGARLKTPAWRPAVPRPKLSSGWRRCLRRSLSRGRSKTLRKDRCSDTSSTQAHRIPPAAQCEC